MGYCSQTPNGHLDVNGMLGNSSFALFLKRASAYRACVLYVFISTLVMQGQVQHARIIDNRLEVSQAAVMCWF